MEEQILNYRIEKLLGEGGMSRVYLGVDPVTGQKVAIKQLLPHLARYDHVRLLFRREAQLLAKLNHPDIVRLFRYEEGELLLVQEYIEGMDLEEYISVHRGPIPEAEAKELFCKLLEAFAYAHGNGVIHRDIKPANILLTRGKQLKVVDFGIGKDTETGTESSTGTRMGTVACMSPEQVVGKEKPDLRTDIYSLGVVLHQMLTGKAPYDTEKESVFEIQTKIVNEPLPRMKGIYEYVSEGMQAVVDKATAKDRRRRYQSCEEFREAILGQEDAKVAPPSRVGGLSGKRAPDKRVIGGVVAALVIALIGFGLMKGVGGSTPAPAADVPAPTPAATPAQATDVPVPAAVPVPASEATPKSEKRKELMPAVIPVPVVVPERRTRHEVGEAYGGGIVFYVDGTGEHGLIAAKEDIVKSYTDQWDPSLNLEGVYFRWSTGEYENTGAGDYAYGELGTGTAIGTGRRNTEKILKRYPARAYPNSAAAVARSYRGGGYSDWFLPSKDELNELYRRKFAVGGFVDVNYWSSSENGSSIAWIQLFSIGFQGNYFKNYLIRVRVVRAF